MVERTLPLNKVDQMDADLIDEQSKMLLKQTLISVFPQNWVIKRPYEIQLVLDFLFFRCTTARDIQTPGLKLQNLKYVFRSKKQMYALFLVQVFVPYLVAKASDFLRNMNWSDKRNIQRGSSILQKLKYIFSKVFTLICQLYKVAELKNFLSFMTTTGDTYRRSVVESLLKVNLARNDLNQTQRSLSFEYVNILVVWTALGKSLANLLPFLDFSRVKKLLLGGSQTLTQTVSFSSALDSNGEK